MCVCGCVHMHVCAYVCVLSGLLRFIFFPTFYPHPMTVKFLASLNLKEAEQSLGNSK